MKSKLSMLIILLLGSFASKSQCSSAFTVNVTPISAQFTVTSPSPNVHYAWSFGNWTYGSGATASCIYALPGTYPITCIATDSSVSPICIDSTNSTITITTGAGICNALFTIIPDSAAGPGNWIGNNQSSGGISYLWNWGDGTTSNVMYPSHSYATSGTYTICLTINGPGGCIDSFCSTNLFKTGGMVNVNFQAPTGVSEVSKSSATIFPNPASDEISIKGNSSTKYQVDIYNLSGSNVLSTSVFGNRAFHISQLPTNIYMVKVTDPVGKIQYAKFAKE